VIDIEGLAKSKAEAINALRQQAAQRGGQESEALGQLVLEDDARVARGEPSQIDWLARDWIEGYRPRRTREERDARRQADVTAHVAREGAARRWQTWISDPANVERLIAMVEGDRPEPEPTPPVKVPWLRFGR
jgi:hypothetical protein